MLSLLLASLAFFMLHRLVSGSRLRDVVANRIGEDWYRRLFALASLLCLTWLWLGFVAAKSAPSNFPLFTPSAGLHPLQLVLQLAAILLIALGISTRNPTIAGMGETVQHPDIVRGVLRITRHPFLWGVSIFSGGHMMVASDAASWIFFGTLLILASTGTLSIDAKRKRVWGDDWNAFANRTSNLPFVAILRGRQRLHLGEIGWLRLGIALATYAVLAAAHPFLFGGDVV